MLPTVRCDRCAAEGACGNEAENREPESRRKAKAEGRAAGRADATRRSRCAGFADLRGQRLDEVGAWLGAVCSKLPLEIELVAIPLPESPHAAPLRSFSYLPPIPAGARKPLQALLQRILDLFHLVAQRVEALSLGERCCCALPSLASARESQRSCSGDPRDRLQKAGPRGLEVADGELGLAEEPPRPPRTTGPRTSPASPRRWPRRSGGRREPPLRDAATFPINPTKEKAARTATPPRTAMRRPVELRARSSSSPARLHDDRDAAEEAAIVMAVISQSQSTPAWKRYATYAPNAAETSGERRLRPPRRAAPRGRGRGARARPLRARRASRGREGGHRDLERDRAMLVPVPLERPGAGADDRIRLKVVDRRPVEPMRLFEERLKSRFGGCLSSGREACGSGARPRARGVGGPVAHEHGGEAEDENGDERASAAARALRETRT